MINAAYSGTNPGAFSTNTYTESQSKAAGKSIYHGTDSEGNQTNLTFALTRSDISGGCDGYNLLQGFARSLCNFAYFLKNGGDGDDCKFNDTFTLTDDEE